MLSLDVLERAQGWIQHDPNPTTVQYVQGFIGPSSSASLDYDDQHVAYCEERLTSLFPPDRLQFGTAGLRARMQPGPMGMNDLVVVQTAQGLARYVIQEHYAGGVEKENAIAYDSNNHRSLENMNKDKHTGIRAVVGYDHRSSVDEPYDVSSLSFAIFTALVFMEAGIDCFLMDGFVPTPLVSYGVLRYVPEQMTMTNSTEGDKVEMNDSSPQEESVNVSDDISGMRPTGCSTKTTIGVMITASHNPAHDAGYKVFWTDGCQIRSPTDQGIAASIQQNLVPWTDYQRLVRERQALFPHDPCIGLSRPHETKQLMSSYYRSILNSGLVSSASTRSSGNSARTTPKFCYTSIHGVGHRYVKEAFQQFGLPPFVSVPQQEQPDPRFPTVAFPNPEEKEALQLAKQFALENGCVFVLANDPDADRMGVSEYDPKTGEWTDFAGDQIGLLLGHWLWSRFQTKGEDNMNGKMQVSMCSSTVSSKVLSAMAQQEGFHHEETLAGFKWIGSKAAELAKSGKYRQVFCYEEALGYCCGDVIFDKDGISACAVLVELAMYVYNQHGEDDDTNGCLVKHLQSLYKRYGEFVSNNGYFLLDDPSNIPLIMDHITQGGTFERLRIPGVHSGDDDDDEIKFYEIASIRYLGEPGYDSTTTDKRPVLATSKSSPMVTIRFTNGGVAQFRASGTEPKFKYYLELRGRPGVDRATVQQELEEWSNAVLQELLPLSRFGLRER